MYAPNPPELHVDKQKCTHKRHKASSVAGQMNVIVRFYKQNNHFHGDKLTSMSSYHMLSSGFTFYLSSSGTKIITAIKSRKRSIFPTAKVLNVPQIRRGWSKPHNVIKMGQFKTFVTTQSFMQTAIIRTAIIR